MTVYLEMNSLRILECLNHLDVFKPGACGLWLHAPGFLKSFLFVRQHVCVSLCVYVSAPKGIITSGVIWYDIGRV